jgi:hypothetical protein
MAQTRLYEVCDNETGTSQLIEATSAAHAVRFCARARYTAGTPNAMEVARLMQKGAKIEKASEES